MTCWQLTCRLPSTTFWRFWNSSVWNAAPTTKKCSRGIRSPALSTRNDARRSRYCTWNIGSVPFDKLRVLIFLHLPRCENAVPATKEESLLTLKSTIPGNTSATWNADIKTHRAARLRRAILAQCFHLKPPHPFAEPTFGPSWSTRLLKSTAFLVIPCHSLFKFACLACHLFFYISSSGLPAAFHKSEVWLLNFLRILYPSSISEPCIFDVGMNWEQCHADPTDNDFFG